MLSGYLDGDGLFVPATTTQKTTDYILVNSAIAYKVEFLGHTGTTEEYTAPRAICYYDADKNYLGRASLPRDMQNMVLPSTTAYIRVNTNVEEIDTLLVYPLNEGAKKYTKILDGVVYDRVNSLENRVEALENEDGGLAEKVNLTIGIKSPYVAKKETT